MYFPKSGIIFGHLNDFRVHNTQELSYEPLIQNHRWIESHIIRNLKQQSSNFF